MARSSPPIRLYLLGTFRIESDSGVLRLPTRKHESLLRTSLFIPKRIHAKNWPRFSGATSPTNRRACRCAPRSPQSAKNSAMKFLSPTARRCNSIPICPLWTDAREFERLSARSTHKLAIGRYTVAICWPISTTIGFRQNASVCARSISMRSCGWRKMHARKANTRARSNSRRRCWRATPRTKRRISTSSFALRRWATAAARSSSTKMQEGTTRRTGRRAVERNASTT